MASLISQTESPSDAKRIIPMMKEKPTTLYIYPESEDIDAVARAVKAGRQRAGDYIGTPLA
jgi:hypothetical protein